MSITLKYKHLIFVGLSLSFFVGLSYWFWKRNHAECKTLREVQKTIVQEQVPLETGRVRIWVYPNLWVSMVGELNKSITSCQVTLGEVSQVKIRLLGLPNPLNASDIQGLIQVMDLQGAPLNIRSITEQVNLGNTQEFLISIYNPKAKSLTFRFFDFKTSLIQ